MAARHSKNVEFDFLIIVVVVVLVADVVVVDVVDDVGDVVESKQIFFVSSKTWKSVFRSSGKTNRRQKKSFFLWQASKQNKKARETFSTNNFLLLLKTWSGPFPHLAALLMKKLFPLSSVKISALTQKMNDEQKPLLGIRSDKTEREREK